MYISLCCYCVAVCLYAVASAQQDKVNGKVDCNPEQVHLAYGDKPTEMVVMWSTPGNCSTEVWYGLKPFGFSHTTNGSMVYFKDVDPVGVPYIHKVKLENLALNTTYFYTPASNNVSRSPFYFTTRPQGSDWSPEFMVYGDLGIHSQDEPALMRAAMSGAYDAIFHVGDFGYNLEQMIIDDTTKTLENPTGTTSVTLANSTVTSSMTTTSTPTTSAPTTSKAKPSICEVGDIFMRMVETMAAHVPYMTAPGNHEIDSDTFAQYRYRFSMPNTDWPIPLNKMWYSVDIGPVHFLSYSTEVFFTSGGRFESSQRDWIIADLNAANENRQACPWVIALGHRPMYCSNADGDDCTKTDSRVRLGLEDVFYKQGVDVVLQAHEHSYERLWPMYKGVVLSRNYSNPPAPVQLVTGAAGSKYGKDAMNPTAEDWSAFRMDDRAISSFGRLKVFNSSHLYWEQVATKNGEVLDSIWITQETHGPFKQADLEPEVKQKISEEIEKEEKIKNTMIKPTETGNSDSSSLAAMLQENKTRIAIGVAFGVFIVLFIVVMCAVQKCRRRPRSYRRWETLDYGKRFYSNVKTEEKDADDFEVEVSDGTTKLLNNSEAD